ncbi:uncharacterized protein MJ1383 [Verrucomicrobiota bacterium]|nr:uncharacterized protein MJ1383 [Verrucomicrobiota bacterium]
MRYIEPHGHMVSRTTDDYQAMALAGCAAICEPAFWAGFDRKSVDGFYDYFCQLTQIEPKRAAKYGLPHYSWLCINPKESEDMALAADVLALIPEFLKAPTVLGIGEIGLNKNTRNEMKVLEQHIGLAVKHDQMILVHTPHLEDKRKGTRLIMDALKANGVVKPERVIIDHVEEHNHPRGPRPRLLGRHHALPRIEVHARARRRHDRSRPPDSASGSTARATGATATRSRCPRPPRRCVAAATPPPPSTASSTATG